MKIKSTRTAWHAGIMGAASLLCALVLLIAPQGFVAVYADEDVAVNTSLPAVDVVPDSASDIHADGSEVTLPAESGMTVTVFADGEAVQVEMYEGTVAEALAKAGVTLAETDRCTPSAHVLLRDDMQIIVNRVTYLEVTTIESVPFATVKQEDDTINKGTTQVAQKGVAGERTIVTRYTQVDGVTTEEVVIQNAITTPPVDEIIKVGTKKVYGKYHGMKVEVKPQTTQIDLASQAALVGTSAWPNSSQWRATVKADGTIIDQFGNTVKYQNKVSGRATAYFAPPGAGTSTGRLASYGVVAVDPKIIPYGTKMFICSADGSMVYGYAVAGDTGGTLLKGSVLVDLYVNNESQCKWIGSRNMTIYILE